MTITVHTTDGKTYITDDYGSPEEVMDLILNGKPVEDRGTKTVFFTAAVVSVQGSRH